ncbi:MAG: hypothetical protein OEY08_05725 [Gammaproteobacteria bacterium]|nr:hypothetical protein [Gammaproteobacteria bacterium]
MNVAGRSERELDTYLDGFRRRLGRLAVARGAAAISIASLLITLVAVTLAIRSGFPPALVGVARLVLLVTIAALALGLVVLPKRRLANGGGREIEAHAPAFSGRIETWLGLGGSRNPLGELLAEDTLGIARDNAPELRVPSRAFAPPVAAAVLAAVALLLLAAAGPGNYAWGVRHLWAGWAIAGLLPPQSIVVSPGDEGIRIGGSLRVRAEPRGFEPGRAWVHASFDGGDWQRVEMAGAAGAFEFTFYSVREPMRYYVSAADVRSPTYEVSVVDLPRLENLVTTLHFPDWTRREPETRDPGGDVRSIAGTRVEVQVRGDRALPPAALVVDGVERPLDIDGDTGRASFVVERDGEYFIAATMGGERIRLSDDYFVTVLADQPPELRFERPGRDWNASPIEEVTAGIVANDDYGVESLRLKYAVNAGEWRSVELQAGQPELDAKHVFFLESIGEATPLVPGDLVAYYAEATDRESSASTDIFFVEVQPFDRRYSQSQQAGGGQQGGGSRQDEISARQREIIVSTWNLIREQKDGKRGDATYVPNNAALLSRLQNTLREQAETLAARTHARQLAATDEQIATFVEHLNLAAASMVPAAERLAEIELEQALQPQQDALKHLLRAEAVFTDISVSMQMNNRGGGGQAGRDLSDMFALEMDLEKNQYETGSRASSEPAAGQLDELRDELERLAQRQEQLARNLNQGMAPTAAERWQQEMLRRDVEELRDRLERMRQQSESAAASAAGGSQSGAQGEAGRREAAELERRLDSALRAMRDADEAMQGSGDPASLEQAASEAQRQLESARDSAAAGQERLMRAALSDLARRADDLYGRQAGLDERLQEAVRSAVGSDDDETLLDSGMSFREEFEMAEAKRQLQSELQSLGQDVKSTASQLKDAAPAAASELDRSLERLRDTEVEARLAVSAAYIEQGEAVYVSGSESAITEALRDFRNSLQRASSLAEGGEGMRAAGEPDRLQRTLAETRELRRALDEFAQGGMDTGAAARRGRDDLQQPTGARVADLEQGVDLGRRAEGVSDAVLEMFRRLRADGIPSQDIDELRRLASEVRSADFSGNEELLEREVRRVLELVEQLELRLASAARSKQGTLRSESVETIPDRHRVPVSTYYRRLGESVPPERR